MIIAWTGFNFTCSLVPSLCAVSWTVTRDFGTCATRQAYFYNFLSALSAVAGVMIILALEGEITSAETAFLLLFGGGSFIFIALAELIPEGLAPKKEGTTSLGLQFRRVLWFIFGGLLIGIPLIWDKHCDEAHDHGHDH